MLLRPDNPCSIPRPTPGGRENSLQSCPLTSQGSWAHNPLVMKLKSEACVCLSGTSVRCPTLKCLPKRKESIHLHADLCVCVHGTTCNIPKLQTTRCPRLVNDLQTVAQPHQIPTQKEHTVTRTYFHNHAEDRKQGKHKRGRESMHTVRRHAHTHPENIN